MASWLLGTDTYVNCINNCINLSIIYSSYDVISRRKVLPSGDCTLSVGLAHIQLLIHSTVVLYFMYFKIKRL